MCLRPSQKLYNQIGLIRWPRSYCCILFASLVQTWMFTFVSYTFLFSLHSTAHPTIPFLVCCCSVARLCLTLCESVEGLIPFLVQFRSVQLLSRVQLFATPWTAAHQTSLSITNSQSLLKLMSIESVMPSNHINLCHPLLLQPSIFPSIRIFSNESVLHIRWPEYWSFSFSISPFSEHSGRTGWISLLPEGRSRVFSNATFQKCQFFNAQLPLWSNSHIHLWLLEKTITLTIRTFVSQAMSQLFNMLSRFVIAFLPRSKCLLISWL